MKKSVLFLSAALCLVLNAGFGVQTAQAQAAVTLHGASQFNADHPFTKGMVKFEELVKKYYGKPINFVMHLNSELGLEKQYFEYMSQGRAVDYAIVSPAHMSTFAKAAPFIDAPFVFRDDAQMNKVIAQDVMKPIADEIAQKADVLLIGYGGGGVRNIFANKPISNVRNFRSCRMVRAGQSSALISTFTPSGSSKGSQGRAC